MAISNKCNQKGLAPLALLLVAAIGLLTFLVLSNTVDFQGGIFKYLYGKKASFAANPGITFLDGSNNPITKTTTATVKVGLTSPWSPKSNTTGFLPELVKEANAQTATSKTFLASGTVNEENNNFFTNTRTLWVGNGNSTTQSYAGINFKGIQLPKGAKITSANLQLYSTQNQWISVNAEITGENVGNSSGFSSSNRPSQKSLTSAKVSHSSNSRWQNKRYYDFTNVTPVIQELVNRSDWNSGNSISLIVKGTGQNYARKFAQSSGSNAPKLIISYTTDAQASTPPTPVPTTSATVTPTAIPTPTLTPTPTPTPNPYVVSAVIAEDEGFTQNVKTINPFSTNPTILDYTFSSNTLGMKMLYAKFTSSTGEEQKFSAHIELVSPDQTNSSPESMAMFAWKVGGKNAPNPSYDKCDDGTDVVAAHNAYYVIAYDGIKYPTWHPPVVTNPITGVGKCYFGHEHGTDPQKYMHWNEMVAHFGKDLNNDGQIAALVIASDGKITEGDRAGIPFGIANEHMDQYYNQEGRDSLFVRHEDHVGHKIEIVNNEAEMVGNTTHPMTQLPGTAGINVPYHASNNVFQPTGVSCAHLHKFHQGTNSADAVRNNLHETIFHSECQSVDVNGINAPAYYPNNKILLTGMMAFGKPGEYIRFCFNDRFTKVCADGKNADGSCIVNDPLISKLPDAINSNSLGRNMVDKYCFDNFASLNPGVNYFNPYELWEGDLGIYTPDGRELAQHGRQWDVLDPVRYVDSSLPNGVGFNQDRCNQNLPYSGNCAAGASGAAWNSPQAAFKGLKRTTYFGRNHISNNGGPTIYWTDPLGRNAVTTQFQSGLKQYIAPVNADIQRVQYRIQQLYGSNNFLNDRAIQRTFNSGGGTVHAPN